MIQICLQLQPTDFCARAEEPLVDSRRNSDGLEHQIDKQQTLKQQIRATIRRLGRQTLTQRAENLQFLPKLLDDFNQHLSVDERRSDGQFLATICDLTAKRPLQTKMVRSLSEKNLPQMKIAKTKLEKAKKIEMQEDLTDELKAISARLATIRQKWTTNGGREETHEEKLNEPPLNEYVLEDSALNKSKLNEPLSSGISSSNSQLELPENYFNKHKYYRKKRPKSQASSTSSHKNSPKKQLFEVPTEADTTREAEFKIGSEDDGPSLAEETNRTYELEETKSQSEF